MPSIRVNGRAAQQPLTRDGRHASLQQRGGQGKARQAQGPGVGDLGARHPAPNWRRRLNGGSCGGGVAAAAAAEQLLPAAALGSPAEARPWTVGRGAGRRSLRAAGRALGGFTPADAARLLLSGAD